MLRSRDDVRSGRIRGGTVFVQELRCYYDIAKLFKKSFVVATSYPSIQSSLFRRIQLAPHVDPGSSIATIPSRHCTVSPPPFLIARYVCRGVSAVYCAHAVGSGRFLEGRSWKRGCPTRCRCAAIPLEANYLHCDPLLQSRMSI